jgi:hypothetical protein
MKRALALCLLAAGVALSHASATQAKGDYRAETFEISGGDLPHPVVVSLPEYNMAVSGEGSWYTGASGIDAPPSTATRYRVEVVAAKDGASLGLPAQDYVTGPPARITGADGVGWAEPIPPIRDLLDRYIALGVRGALPQHPTFAEAVSASRDAFGAAVTANGSALPPPVADRFLALVGRAVPVVFGVRGRLIGQRNLHAVQVEVRLGAGTLAFAYVPPGPVAHFGLLFNRAGFGGWGYVTMLDPPGYTQDAYTVPQEFDQLMNDAGFQGADEGELVDSHVVLLDQAKLTYGNDHIEVWRGDGPHLRVAIPDAYDNTTPCSAGDCVHSGPVPPFTGDPLNVEIWPLGVDPFPDAVRPAELTYYPDDGSHAGHGVLVQSQGGVELSGTYGGEQPPYYADVTMDALLRDAARHLDRQPGRSRVKAFAVGAAAVLGGVLAIVWTSLNAERKRRQDG